MAEFIANEDMLVEFTNQTGPPDLVYGGDVGLDAVTTPPSALSTKSKAGGKFLVLQGVGFCWCADPCPFTSATHTFDGGLGQIIAEATKILAESQVPLRENDDSNAPEVINCAGGWIRISDSAYIDCTCLAKVSSAGQSKARGE